jgi:hypothetical protein
VLARAAAVLASLLAVGSPRVASAGEPASREPLVFVADPKFGVETSVRTIDSLGRVAFRYEDALPSVELGAGPSERLARYFGRVTKLFFLDEPIAELTTVVAHEVGGHGARGRELGLRPTFQLYLPGIYRILFSAPVNDEVAGSTTFNTGVIVEEPREITSTLGGLEANYVQAWWINARIVRARGWVHHGDLLVYAASKLAYADSFVSPSIERPRSPSSNDVSSYVTSLQELSNGWRAEDGRRIARRLRAGYLVNLVDPTLLYAMYGTVVSTLVEGARMSRMPLPSIRGVSLLLTPRFGLTPFGAEQMLDVFLADRSGRMLDVYARVGTSGIASYYGAGARILGVRASERITAGGELDVWRQPQILLDERGVFDTPVRAGVNVGLYGDVRITRELGLTGKLAAKTPGYVMGQPIVGGPHGYLGVSLAWP